MAKVLRSKRSIALYENILKLNSVEECCRFFDDLCTVSELRAMEQRFDVAALLRQGLVYTDILAKTGASSATISRVNRVFSFGTGCLAEIMERPPVSGCAEPSPAAAPSEPEGPHPAEG